MSKIFICTECGEEVYKDDPLLNDPIVVMGEDVHHILRDVNGNEILDKDGNVYWCGPIRERKEP